MNNVKGFKGYKIDENGKVFKGDSEVKPQVSNRFNVLLKDNDGQVVNCNPELLQLLANDVLPEKTGLVPCFRDGNPFNCSLHNLYWGTEKKRLQGVDPLTPVEHDEVVSELMKPRAQRPTKSSLALLFQCSITRITRCEKEAKKKMALAGLDPR